MTTHKDFKRLVRGRMQKTGESYTAARAQLLARRRNDEAAKRRSVPLDYARLAGKSDATLKENTGCTWERWVKALDHVDASTWRHRDIAKYVREKYKLPSWWAQTVTVGYERIQGLRVVGQKQDGSFEASKSRTFAVPLSRLYQAFHDARVRSQWLPGVDLTIRTARRGKSMRITWPDRTSIEVGFASQGNGKSRVAVSHVKLPDKAAAT